MRDRRHPDTKNSGKLGAMHLLTIHLNHFLRDCLCYLTSVLAFVALAPVTAPAVSRWVGASGPKEMGIPRWRSGVDADLTGALEAANAPSPFAIVLLAEDAGNSGSTSRSELEALRKAYPAATVAVISDHDDSETILRAVRGGAKGFIHTSLRSEAVVHALRG